MQKQGESLQNRRLVLLRLNAKVRAFTPKKTRHSPNMVLAEKRAESRTRYYTRDEAKRVGWDVGHPSRGGCILEEQELVNFFPQLKNALGAQRPDFAAIATDRKLRAVIECKGDARELDLAVAEAKHYAETINEIRGFDVRLAVGVAGTPDKFVQTRGYFWSGQKWISLTSHGYALTQLPTLHELQVALKNNNGTTDVQLPDEREFFDAAVRISRILRLAKVEESVRPKVIGAIILALYQSATLSFERGVVLEQVNVFVKAAISGFTDVPSERREFLVKTLTLSTEADRLRDCIEDIVYQLERLNVRSIMRSGVDFLGQFYETFLRYGQDSKKLGIVFTPRHITRFCAELADIKIGMTVYDPACGTGGFLVAAFDRMMREATTTRAKEMVRKSLNGYDTNATVWSLAVLNMFFRGDGKSQILYGSCFEKEETELFHCGLLNPPFSQEGEPETAFIDHALQNLRSGGQLAVVVKTAVMVDPDLAHWRRALVANHHVLAVISLPSELFYPTGAPCVIVLIKAHTPDMHLGTFLARISNDGFRISKKRRVPATGSQLEQVLKMFRRYTDKGTIKTVAGLACVIDRHVIADGGEICAEYWLPSAVTDADAFESQRQELLGEMSIAVATYPDVTEELIEGYEEALASGNPTGKPGERAKLSDWFTISNGKSKSGKRAYASGTIPYISSSEKYNGIVEMVAPHQEGETYETPHATVSAFGHARIQPWRFCARGNGGSAVRVLKPKFPMTLSELVWVVGQVNAQRWRFFYGRMATANRLSELKIDAPLHDLPHIMGLEARLHNFRRGLRVLAEGKSGGMTIEQRFETMANEWRRGRGPASSVTKLSMHSSYQQIIGMGEPVVPLIMAELERKPDHWFWALHAITGADPVTKEARGRIGLMSEAWIAWAKEQGFTW